MTVSAKEKIIKTFVQRARIVNQYKRGEDDLIHLARFQSIIDTYLECARAVKIWI